jgi:hypothetical protein
MLKNGIIADRGLIFKQKFGVVKKYPLFLFFALISPNPVG